MEDEVEDDPRRSLVALSDILLEGLIKYRSVTSRAAFTHTTIHYPGSALNNRARFAKSLFPRPDKPDDAGAEEEEDAEDEELPLVYPDPVDKSCHRNRLIIFKGNFNPPHAGHVQALCSAFEPRVAATMPFMAALIIITRNPDDGTKPSNFEVKERARIWREIIKNTELLSGLVAVYPDEVNDIVSDTVAWGNLAAETYETARLSAFTLEYVPLVGADVVRGGSGNPVYPPPAYDWGPRGCDVGMLLLTDASVDAVFRRYENRRH
ncbi:hypothetical protein QBC43DRAFT_291687 [Cladorrhinum sp. PSN259]|nr:hypothetical protein QBC43DRAFT_291687 [Cladorrhinum sp. PSN259]